MSNLVSISIDHFIQFWQCDRSLLAEHLFSKDVQFTSSHSGHVSGLSRVILHLDQEFPPQGKTKIYSTNIVEKGNVEARQTNAYFYGKTSTDELSCHFGGMIVILFKNHLIREVKVKMNWVDGDKQLLTHWKLPLARLWKPNDPKSSVIISELDAVWHQSNQNQYQISQNNEEEQVVEAWYRYAWGLDLADAGLYVHTFTENAIAELPPMGILKGKREIISTLKAFRMPWPSIQHYGEPIHVNIDKTTGTAELIIGRIIPQHAKDSLDHPIYAAHYKIDLCFSDIGQWQIQHMKYVEGWIKKSII